VRDADGSIEEDRDNDPSVLYDGPLVVLTSRFSASASEILAGALQDYGRALIVGDASTHGKGPVHSVNTLKPYMRLGNVVWTNDPGALKVTIKKFYRASGASTQLKGVVPDIVLPSVISESKDFGESALDNPMPWDTIPSAEFQRLNLVDGFAAELRKRSAERVARDQDFAYIREDIEQFKKLQEDKTVSLNEQQRIKEKEEADARQKARDRERRARPEPLEKVYEITLKQVDLPGLPPPLQRTNQVSAVTNAGAASPISASADAETAAAGDGLENADETARLWTRSSTRRSASCSTISPSCASGRWSPPAPDLPAAVARRCRAGTPAQPTGRGGLCHTPGLAVARRLRSRPRRS
jgi:carboxyl-terminal processing protease